MAEFLTTQGILHELENIIMNANSRIVLISPYVKLPQTLFERLKDKDNRNVKITLVYGKDELNPAERSKLEQLNNLSLYFRENLHAKCFFNEEHMVIASMNMYEYSANNREMGVLIRAKGDEKVYNEAVKEAESILASAAKDSLKRSVFSKVVKETKSIFDSTAKDDSRRTRTTSRTKKEGYCIRCKISIPYNFDSPYCHDCWGKWDKKGGNPDYREPDGRCHACGKPAPTSKAKPLCLSCFNKLG